MEKSITKKFQGEFIKFLKNWNKENPNNRVSMPASVVYEIYLAETKVHHNKCILIYKADLTIPRLSLFVSEEEGSKDF